MMSAVHDFTIDCYARGLSRRTIETYRSNLKLFLEHNPNPHGLENKDLRQHLQRLRNRELKISTINGHFAAISSFYDYLAFENNNIRNPIPPFRRRYIRNKRVFNGMNTRQIIDIHTMEELIKLPFSIPENTHIKEYTWTVPIRDQAIMLMLAKTGIRRQELVCMDIDDINMKTRKIHIRPFAKRTNCLTFIDDEMHFVLKEYLRWRESTVAENNYRLWITHTGHKMKKDHPNDIVKFYALRLGIHNPRGPLIEKYTTHCFRHFFTTWLRRHGMSREHRKWLRGDSPDGPDDLYDHIDEEVVRKEYFEKIPRLL
ncbi:tyrosine-type recombinase/integrase [Methanococcoides sp. SA1]|nr:tyrosine-type recombinase/integrase [Methanococcoides sp. SA1]